MGEVHLANSGETIRASNFLSLRKLLRTILLLLLGKLRIFVFSLSCHLSKDLKMEYTLAHCYLYNPANFVYFLVSLSHTDLFFSEFKIFLHSNNKC